jgi:hypothetical protein
MSDLQFRDYFKKLQEGKIPPQFSKDKKPEDEDKHKEPDGDEDSEGKEPKDDKDEEKTKTKGKFPFTKKKEDLKEALNKKKMKKLSAKKFDRANDYIYYADDKFYFEDTDGEMIEIKNKGYLSDINKAYSQKDLKESLNADDMLDALQNASGTDDKFDQALWEWFEENMADSGIYAGDATPDEYLDAMSDAQIKKCYNEMAKHFKKQLSKAEALDEVYSYTHTWTKEELLEFISELEDDEVQEVGDFIMGELMEDDDFEDDDFEFGSYEDEELDEVHYFDKKKSQLDREKKKNISARKMKAKLLRKYYKKNKAKIARKAKIYRKKAKRNPSKVFHHKK